MDARTPAGAARDAIAMQLYALFQKKGYEGVSIADVSKATGLGRSSLYHHFPGGKAEMAQAVAAFARSWLSEHVFEPLHARDRPAAERVDQVAAALDQLYDGGGKPCVVASLLVGRGDDPLAGALKTLLEDWIDAFQTAARDAGAAEDAARMRAAGALARIEGALMLSRALGDRRVFAEALEQARRDLLGLPD